MSTFSSFKFVVCAGLMLTLGGCLTMSGRYKVTGVDANGVPGRVVILTKGSGIYSARNSYCMANPKGTVTIRDMDTDEELTSESPYHCR
ncbi:hypothetical protein ACI77J_22160 [Pseudomonas sp. O64]|uniref:hypothetical protein n=1 Tax=Pseudomonas TaxID=286 RepID=UPI000BA0B2FF|nr:MULTISPECIES: hypothetical protein [unclassified Pseudomonas]MCV2227691.1 hypothetical protein [Pseudomonas sp. AU10]OZO04892.1 hypothetical protein B7453_08945 [Pseudomonas sp. IB20]UNM22374.1 hypothetical protein K0P33_13385 [Pseudomonas sp. ArH3a]UXZ25008.1 hypothetical protein KZH41_12750 [Pseudomonas sp. YeP6b]